MSATTTETRFNRFAPISLDELNGQAELQTRVDRKYLLESSDLDSLLGDMSPNVRVLEIDGRRRLGYESTYFDTRELDSYLAAVRGRPNRFKIRIRTYLDTDHSFVEVKTRDRGRATVKARIAASIRDHEELGAVSQQFVADTLASQLPPNAAQRARIDRLVPALTTSYLRTTLLVDDRSTGPHAHNRSPSRVTMDTALNFAAPGGPGRFLPDLVIVETKTAGPPSGFDHGLWLRGHRPLKVSKYGTGLALLRPELPAHKWHRVLKQHFESADLPSLASRQHLQLRN